MPFFVLAHTSIKFFSIFIDNFICTLSIFLVLITGFWKANPPVAISELVHFSPAHYWIHHSNRLPLRRIKMRKISCPQIRRKDLYPLRMLFFPFLLLF
jgi:hypothetical protein